jgi:hypothetical protein
LFCTKKERASDEMSNVAQLWQRDEAKLDALRHFVILYRIALALMIDKCERRRSNDGEKEKGKSVLR